MFEFARTVAMTSGYKFRHGAVLTRGSAIIKASPNKQRAINAFNLYHKNHRASVHAEIGCILNLNKEITECCDIYVCRILANGTFANSKPCEMCEQVCAEMGINKIYYTNQENDFGVIKIA